MKGTIIAALPVAAIFGFAGYRVGTGRGRPVLGAVRPGRNRDRPRKLSGSNVGTPHGKE